MGLSSLKSAIKNIDQKIKTKQNEGGDRPREEKERQGEDTRKSENHRTEDADKKIVSAVKGDIFNTTIDDKEVPSIFKRTKHNQPPQGSKCGESDEPVQTNNFSNNLMLDDQTFPVWTQPYSMWLTKDADQDFGFAFNHTEDAQRVFGPDPDSKVSQYYFNPPKIKSFVISGEGFKDVKLTVGNHGKLSATAKLELGGDKNVSMPLVQGMGFITAKYNKIKPIFASQVGVQEFKQQKNIGNISKYRVRLFNQVIWSLYVDGNTKLSLKDPNHIVGDGESNCTFQFCRGESSVYDDAAGSYAAEAELEGLSKGKKAQLAFKYKLQGKSKSGKSVFWCLPHHQEVLTSKTQKEATDLKLDSTTKGVMKAYLTDRIEMEEELPSNIQWEPWSPSCEKASYSDNALKKIKEAAEKDVQQDAVTMADIDSMYTSGKILDKFAYILYVCKFILKDDKLTSEMLPKIKTAVEIFAKNHQKFPLVYDSSWKGLVSSAEPGADFGNANYNDHHFHYGYHIHAIALVAKVDKDWLYANDNLVLNYANTLIKDVANPKKDKSFPQFRSFDWFHGHSFAHGIFPSGDGKDEESSSEDYHFAYGMKLYALIVEDRSMETRADLMLAITRRAINMYMLFSDDNKIQPKRVIANKVSGILFENKIDYATYFGRGTIGDEWIHGIHMLPITPISAYMRKETFVREEWDAKIKPIIDRIPDGWKGVLMLNLALIDPKAAWKWFSRDDWNDALIDNGMSRTWSLAYIAGIGGAK